jgi:hypothetical protein
MLNSFGEVNMTLCPIAMAVGCQKCPAFAICPLKGVIGDKGKAETPSPKGKSTSGAGTRAKKAR